MDAFTQRVELEEDDEASAPAAAEAGPASEVLPVMMMTESEVASDQLVDASHIILDEENQVVPGQERQLPADSDALATRRRRALYEGRSKAAHSCEIGIHKKTKLKRKSVVVLVLSRRPPIMRRLETITPYVTRAS